VKELRRANEILKNSGQLPRGRAGPATDALAWFIGEHKSMFGIEPICRALTAHGASVAPSAYYAAVGRPPSARAVRGGQPKTEISRVTRGLRRRRGLAGAQQEAHHRCPVHH
jgi:hypothetical protein